jgi:DNA repair protein RadC
MSRSSSPEARRLRQALTPYINIRQLRRLAAADCAALHSALLMDQPPPELLALLDLLSALLSPLPCDRIIGPDDVAALLMVEMSRLSQEQLRVICLNTKGYVQSVETVYQGTVRRAEVRPSELFREAIRRNSASIILAHNHPSGDPTPSPQDITLTKQVQRAGKLLGIRLLDHVVIGNGAWISLCAQGVL